MGNEELRKMTPGEIKGVKINDARMLDSGADINAETGQIIATEDQVRRATAEMEENALSKKVKEIFPSPEHLEIIYQILIGAKERSKLNAAEDAKVKEVKEIFQKALNGLFPNSNY